MATFIVIAAIVALAGILFGGFVAICRGIRRADKWGNLRPETLAPQRHNLLAYASRWDDNTPAFA
jgi:hypothetical protein